MWKSLLAIGVLGAASIFLGLKHSAARTADVIFRCRLPDIQCDSCRDTITREIFQHSGIRRVHFEGEDRKELVVTHAPSRSEDSLRATLVRLGYTPNVAQGTTKSMATGQCACPLEQAKSAPAP
jgi:hypothetical protein